MNNLLSAKAPLIKVCGTREIANIQAIDGLGIDYMGFIFYPKSPRCATAHIPMAFNIGTKAKRVGVFVNEKPTVIKSVSSLWHLSHIQLHGDEPPEHAKFLSHYFKLDVWKAFRIVEDFDWNLLTPYHEFVSAFVFDAPGYHYGGNGKTYNWELLKGYAGPTPFWLSGGLGLRNITDIKAFSHPLCIGYDINSKFEVVPGIKNISLVSKFLEEIRSKS